jgi:dipeptidyl-peptidase-3
MSTTCADDSREGWCATVNLERTKAFSALVDGAPTMIPLLPWSKEFEKDKFLSPDFTSLEVRHIYEA